jgi:phosphoserine phosphatase RsbU/P
MFAKSISSAAIVSGMESDRDWKTELAHVVELMRDISQQTDPQEASVRYARGLREGGFFPFDAYLSLSRRNMPAPKYRITRSSTWKENINPWREPEKLPVFSSGLLGELIYSNEAAVIEDLDKRISPSDPAYDYMKGMKMLVAAPHFDGGLALNMGITLVREPREFPVERIPGLVLQANLWGRGVRNLVLRQELAQAYNALDAEMQVVGEMQRSLLPTRLPEIAGLDLAAYYQTARRSGGDYYDFFPCGKDCWGFCIADVSGHGTPAAVIMAITHAIAHLHPGCGTPPGAVLGFINRHLTERYIGGSGAFVTAFYGIYHPASRKLVYARAGHNPPRLLRGNSAMSLSEVGGLPLGIEGEESYEECTIQLNAGDLLLLYTDGITEARGPAGGMFGVEALDQALVRGSCKAQTAIDRILESLTQFTQGASPADDQTILAMAVR